MTTKATRKMAVPDIGGLLGKISEKREEMPKTPVQTLQPVDEKAEDKPVISKTIKTLKSKNSGALSQKNIDTAKQTKAEAKMRGTGGRPTVKKNSVEYVKMSPRIPKALKKRVDIALIHERFVDKDGNAIKTLDEIVAHALEKLLSYAGRRV
jgi:hypothetical protein